MIDSLPSGPAHAELRAGLIEIRQRIGEVEAGVENATMSHQDVINASAEIAARFRELGSQHPELGQALDHPRVFEDVYEPAATPGGRERIRTDQLGAETGTRQVLDVERFGEVNEIPEGGSILYVLRDRRTGGVLKVGSTDNPLSRFTRYNRMATELGLQLELEITPVRLEAGQEITHFEGILRRRMESAGHILPLDYTKVGGVGRMGRRGPGTPFESLPGGSPLTEEGWGWEFGAGPQKGYLLPPGGVSATPPTPRTRLTPEDLTTMVGQGLSNAEIARRVGVDPSTVSRARQRLGL
jgi:hypothetical protein